jgi:hypothetical protein
MDANQIIALLQARGINVPPNAEQLLQNWQAQRAAMQPGQPNLPNWRAQFPQAGRGQFAQHPFAQGGFERADVMQRPGSAFPPLNAVMPYGANANPLPMNFPNPMLPSNPVTTPGVPVTPFNPGVFNPVGGKGGGVGRTMTGGNPNFGAMAF